MVSISVAGAKAGAHSRRQRLLPLVRVEYELPFEHVDKFVLVRVAVPQRRLLTGENRDEVHAHRRQPECVAEPAHRARQDARVEPLGVAGSRLRLDVSCFFSKHRPLRSRQ